MAILDYPSTIWQEALELTPDEIPLALILEGTWWRATVTESRLSHLTNVRELNFPDMFIGEYNGVSVAY